MMSDPSEGGSSWMINHEELISLSTEKRNPKTMHIDECSSLEIVRLMNQEDRTVADAVSLQEAQIARAIDAITAHLRTGGRLFYIGAGTSGRLGLLDASECPPTFGVDPSLVYGIMAGGLDAFQTAVEGLEDSFDDGRAVISHYGIGEKDIVVGITASGRTPYVLGALEAARERQIMTVGISNTVHAALESIVDIPIIVPVGPEALTGSTRLKAGTSQKMILNMLSTGTMIRLGKVYENLMIDLRPTNQKLIERARHIVCEATGADYNAASLALLDAGNSIPVAILIILKDCSSEEAQCLLSENSGNLRAALKSEVFYHA